MDNIEKVLDEMGKAIITDAKKNLKSRKKDKRSSGKLRKSLKYETNNNSIEIYGEDYAEFVDQGTKEIKGNEFLTDAVDNNIEKYGEAIADAVVEDILSQIDLNK